MQNKRNKGHPKLEIQKIFSQAQFQFEESSRDVPLPYINRNILHNTNPITFSPQSLRLGCLFPPNSQFNQNLWYILLIFIQKNFYKKEDVQPSFMSLLLC